MTHHTRVTSELAFPIGTRVHMVGLSCSRGTVTGYVTVVGKNGNTYVSVKWDDSGTVSHRWRGELHVVKS